MNQLVNEAVKDYVHRRSREVERDLEATLLNLRAYRRRDPGYEDAIVEFANAEARHARFDLAEGEVVVTFAPTTSRSLCHRVRQRHAR